MGLAKRTKKLPRDSVLKIFGHTTNASRPVESHAHEVKLSQCRSSGQNS